MINKNCCWYEETCVSSKASIPGSSSLCKTSAPVSRSSSLCKTSAPVPGSSSLCKTSAQIPGSSSLCETSAPVPESSSLCKTSAQIPRSSSLCETSAPVPESSSLCKTSAPRLFTSSTNAHVSTAIAALSENDISLLMKNDFGSDSECDSNDENEEEPLMPELFNRAAQFQVEDDDETEPPLIEEIPASDDRTFLSQFHAPLPCTLHRIEAPELAAQIPVEEPFGSDPAEEISFVFDWVNCADFPPPPPKERRKTFKSKQVGPTAEYQCAYDAFTAIWNPEFMQVIADETNRYAQQKTALLFQQGLLEQRSRLTQWRDTTVDELYVFFALVLAMGSCIKTYLPEYWQKEDDVMQTANVGKYMTFDRFTLLQSCLHFSDNLRTERPTLPRSQARVAKIQPIIDHLNEKFQQLYCLHQNIALDESLAAWQGPLAFKQIIKTKAAEEGIKTYEICDSLTSYLWKFVVYAGRDNITATDSSPYSNYIVSLVLGLLRGLENKGHTVWMDNYYNSPVLARILSSLGFDCAGTLRTNRQGVPPQIKSLTKENMTVGQVCGCTSGDVDIVVWRDTNRVAMISTYHGTKVRSVGEKTKPIVVIDYNFYMGGVDKKDQLLSMYPIERKRTRVWYKKFFRRLLNVSVLNSYILYRDGATKGSVASTTMHRVFRKNLVAQLLKTHNKRPDDPTIPKLRFSFLPKPIMSEEIVSHFVEYYGFVKEGSNRRMRRACVVCHVRQPFFCPACNVPLCVGECSREYHLRV